MSSLLIVAGYAAVAASYIYWRGLSLSPDSARYVMVALQMRAGLLPVPPVWPPLYPALVALLTWIAPFPADAAALLNGLALVATALLFHVILGRLDTPRLPALLATLALLTLPALLTAWQFALSEATFIAFTLAAIYALTLHTQTKQTHYYVLAALVVACTALTRYMGYSLIATFALYTAWHWWHTRQRAVLYLWPLSWLPSLAYLVRNYAVFDTLHGIRPPATQMAVDALLAIRDTLWLDWPTALLVLLVVSLTLWVALPQKTMPIRWVLWLFAGLYCAQLVVSTQLFSFCCIDYRTLVPLYPILLLLAASLWHDANRPTQRAIALLLALAIVVQTPAAVRIVLAPPATTHLGAGFEHSPAAARLRALLLDRLAERDTLHVAVLFDYSFNASRPRATLGRALCLRSALFQGKHISRTTVRSVLGGVEISLALNGQPRRILCHDLPAATTSNAELMAALHAQPVQEWLLFVHSDPAFVGHGLAAEMVQADASYTAYVISFQ